MSSYSLLNLKQRKWLRTYCQRHHIKLNIKRLDGVLFVLKRGCQWRLVPSRYGRWKSVYHFFRGISERRWFANLLKKLLSDRRQRLKGKQRRNPRVAIIDSQSSRSGLPQSQKGVGGNKRIKADNGYKGSLTQVVKDVLSVDMQCVKSNYGTSEFMAFFVILLKHI